MLKNRKKLRIFLVLLISALACASLLLPLQAHAATIEPIYKVLQTQTAVKDVWSKVLLLVNSLGIAFLIFIAFTNILRININNYAIKKILPTLVLTIIAANFSYLICRLLVDLANIACSLLINGSSGTATTITAAGAVSNVNGAFDFATKFPSTDISTENYGVYLLYALGEFVGVIFMLILAFLFFIRNYIIYFLVALAPLAFVCLVLPQTKSVFNQWWSNFWKWTFLPIVSLFWLWVGGQWANSAVLSGAGYILTFGFAIACYYLAITTPFKMGGTIMQQWGNLGKKVWGSTAGNAWKYTGGKTIDNYKKLYNLKAQQWWEKQGEKGRIPIISGMAKRSANMRERIKLEEETLGRQKTDTAGAVYERNKRLANLRNITRKVGGGDKLVDLQQQEAYNLTARGIGDLNGRKLYLASLATAEGNVKRQQTEVERDFLAGRKLKEGEKPEPGKVYWGDEKSKYGRVRNDLLTSQQNLSVVEAQLKKVTNDEVRDGLARQKDAFDRVEDVDALIRHNTYLQKQARGETLDSRESADFEDIDKRLSGIKRRVGFDLGMGEDEITAALRNPEQLMQRKIGLISSKLSKDNSGRLIVPYHLQPVLSLSADGASISGLKTMKDPTLGPSFESRLSALLGSAIQEEISGNTVKYNISQMAKFLLDGKPGDFSSKDIELIMEGKGNEVRAENKAKAIGMWRAFWTAQNAHPDSLNGQQFADSLPDVLAMLKETDPTKLQEFAGETESRIRKQMQNRGWAQDRIERNMTEQKNRLEDWRDADGNPDPIAYISHTMASRQNRRMSASVIAMDPVIGTAMPASNSFSAGAGEQAGYRYSRDLSAYQPTAQLDSLGKLADDFMNNVVTSAGARFQDLASKVKSESRRAGVSDQLLTQRVFEGVHQAKIATADNFAKSIGLLAQNGELSPMDRELMLGIMKNMRKKNRARIERDISSTFGGRYNLAQGQNVSVSENAIEPESKAAEELSIKIEAADKLASSDLVDSVSTHFSGIRASYAPGPSTANSINQLSEQSMQALSKIEALQGGTLPDDLSSQIAEILSHTGRTREHIQDMLSRSDISDVETALFDTSNAAKAMAGAIDPSSGQFDEQKAKENLYATFVKERWKSRIGDILATERPTPGANRGNGPVSDISPNQSR